MNEQPAPLVRKWTDTDVRLRPNLERMAYHYVLDYTGEFEFLLNARHIALRDGKLTVAMARGVLNCMRNDASIVMPEFPTPRPSAPRSSERDNVIPWVPRCRKEGIRHAANNETHCVLPRDHDGDHADDQTWWEEPVDWTWERPRHIVTNARGPRFFVLANGSVVHQLQHVKSMWEVGREGTRFKGLNISTYCNYRSWTLTGSWTPGEITRDKPTNVRDCKSCTKVIERIEREKDQ